ncbi:MAG: hypothetical protein PUP91_31945, partial [Rhizonema sp. PD37]|nr:hypothetical protein [Rhizonema sp. PD37]
FLICPSAIGSSAPKFIYEEKRKDVFRSGVAREARRGGSFPWQTSQEIRRPYQIPAHLFIGIHSCPLPPA